MELIKLYTALLRRKWLVLQSIVLFTAFAIALALLLPKNYTATSRVLVSSSDATLSILSDLGLGEVAAGLNGASDDMATRIALSTTRPVVDEVVWRLQLRDDDGKLYTYDQILVAGLTGELEARPNLKVTQQQGTDLLAFEVRAPDPQLAQLFADTAVKVAIQTAVDNARSETTDARRFIEAQLVVVKQEFDSALQEIADAQSAEQVIDLDTEIRAAVGRLSELLLAFETNTAAIEELRARINEARRYQSQESASLVSPATAAANARVQNLRDKILSLEQERASELQDKTERHPDIVRIDALLTLFHSELDAAIEEQHALDPNLQAMEAQLAGLIEKGAGIQESIRSTTQQFSVYPEKLRRLTQLQLAAEAAQNVFQSLEEQRYQIGVAEAMLVSDLQFVEAATLPDRHSSPKLLVFTILGLIAGCSVGLGLALLLEYIDDSVKAPADVEEVWPLSRLGLVPRFKLEGERRVIDGLAPTDPVAEAYRTVRNSLRFAGVDRSLRLLGVTSAQPGEGKSTLATNLAISYARDGLSVLLIDLDLRRPTQHRNFPTIHNGAGLSSVLSGQIGLDDALQATPVPGLTLLTSGPTPPDPSRMVESQRLAELLAQLGQRFDMVIVDTPPALVVGDALVLARHLDGFVVLVGSNQTSRRLILDLRQRWEAQAPAPLGYVLNRMDFQSAGYGHYLKVYKRYTATPDGQGGGRTGGKTGGGPS